MTKIARSEDMLKKSMSGYRVRGFGTKAGSILTLPFFCVQDGNYQQASMTIHLMSVRSLGFIKAQGVKSMFDRQVPRKRRLVGGVKRPNGLRGPMGQEAQWVEGHNEK